jgi:hypothetical protein
MEPNKKGTTLPSPVMRDIGVWQWQTGLWSAYRCKACKHLWINPIPTAAELEAFYDKGYFCGDTHKRGYADYDADKQSVKKDFSDHLEAMEEKLPQKGMLLDIGAATAKSRRSWSAAGVELSTMRRRSVAGLDIKQARSQKQSFHDLRW